MLNIDANQHEQTNQQTERAKKYTQQKNKGSNIKGLNIIIHVEGLFRPVSHFFSEGMNIINS